MVDAAFAWSGPRWWVDALPHPPESGANAVARDELLAFVDRLPARLRPLGAHSVWSLAVGRHVGPTNEDNPGIAVWLTGTWLAAGTGADLGACYRMRFLLCREMGVPLVPGADLCGAPDPRASYPVVSDAQRAGAALAAAGLARSGVLLEPLRRLGSGVVGIPVVLPTRLPGRITCPGHDDEHPSLGVRQLPDGRVVGRCHVCGSRFAFADGLAFRAPERTVRDPAPTYSIRSRNNTGGSPPRRPSAPVPAGPLEFGPRVIGMRIRSGQATFRVLRAAGDRDGSIYRAIRTRAGGPAARRASESCGTGQIGDQRYESVGVKRPDPDRDVRWTLTGRRFPVKFSVAAGTQRVIVDVDGLSPCSSPRADGSDPELPAVLLAARLRALLDPRMGVDAGVDLVETSDDGVQLHLWLPRFVSDERSFYDDQSMRAWWDGWCAWLIAEIGRGGRADGAVWRPGGYCRVPGWRWCHRTNRSFRARLVDEEEIMKTRDEHVAEWEARSASRKADRDADRMERDAADRRVPSAAELAAQIAQIRVEARAPQSYPSPFRAAEQIVAACGGRPWVSREKDVVRVYFHDGQWVEMNQYGRPSSWSEGLSDRRLDLASGAASKAPAWSAVDAAQARREVEALVEAFAGKFWSGKASEVYRCYFDDGTYLEIRPGHGTLFVSPGTKAFVVRRAAKILCDLRRPPGHAPIPDPAER